MNGRNVRDQKRICNAHIVALSRVSLLLC